MYEHRSHFNGMPTSVGETPDMLEGPEIHLSKVLDQPPESIKSGLMRLPDGSHHFAVTVDPHQVPITPVFCLQDKDNPTETAAAYQLTPLSKSADGSVLYGGIIPGIQPGSHYGIYLPAIPEESVLPKRPSLVQDPYGRAASWPIEYGDSGQSQRYSVAPKENLNKAERPSSPVILAHKRVIYEAHVKDSTQLHPDVPEHLRGSYLGFVHPAHLKHLKELGVTTIELLPPFQFDSRHSTKAMGRENHWGYGSTSHFAPHTGYATEQSRQNPEDVEAEFRQMVDVLHANGFEVVLDVVYNHTSDDSPLLRLNKKGHYLHDDNGNYSIDHTGVGNDIDGYSPQSIKYIMDSLHYWADDVGVDGFRFDLAGALAKDKYGQGRISDHPLFEQMIKDEVLSKKLLIIEPWLWGDKGTDERYRDIDGFDEWSDETKKIFRKFWASGECRDISQLSQALTGLSEGRNINLPIGLINFITAHDGFNLEDLVSYRWKRNWPNGEDNRDGMEDNMSNNFGVEGATEDESILYQRERAKRNLLTSALLAMGTPMILSGDELSHTKDGNNNNWNQDNPTSYLNWELDERKKKHLDFTKGLIKLRQQCHLFGTGKDMGNIPASPIGEMGVDWFHWASGKKVFGMYTSGLIGDDSAMSIIHYVNGGHSDQQIELPKEGRVSGKYSIVLDTDTGVVDLENNQPIDGSFTLKANSQVVLRRLSSERPQDTLSQDLATQGEHIVGPVKVVDDLLGMTDYLKNHQSTATPQHAA